jgi:CheY-like chemotaxis protein
MILLVDDNALFAEMMREIVIPFGFALGWCESGEEAIEIIRARPDVRLVFMDYALPGGMSGVRAASEIRKLPPPGGTVPIIGLTGGHSYDDLELRAAAQFAAEIQKPILPRDIEDLIIRYIRRWPAITG